MNLYLVLHTDTMTSFISTGDVACHVNCYTQYHACLIYSFSQHSHKIFAHIFLVLFFGGGKGKVSLGQCTVKKNKINKWKLFHSACCSFSFILLQTIILVGCCFPFISYLTVTSSNMHFATKQPHTHTKLKGPPASGVRSM